MDYNHRRKDRAEYHSVSNVTQESHRTRRQITMNSNPAFVIDAVDEIALRQAINKAPNYETKVASAIKRSIRMIHGLPALHRNAPLEDLEIYLGRASTHTVLNRWRASRRDRGHKYATILFSCDTERAVELEGLANKLLRELKDRKTLCVGNANVNPHGGGMVADNDDSVVYMTWGKFGDLEYATKPDIDSIREVAQKVAETYSETFTYNQIENGLRLAKRLSAKERLDWFL